jgi:hypothetical protein
MAIGGHFSWQSAFLLVIIRAWNVECPRYVLAVASRALFAERAALL